MSISFPRSISAYLIAVYSTGAGVAIKVDHRQRKADLSTIYMQVDTVLEFAWI